VTRPDPGGIISRIGARPRRHDLQEAVGMTRSSARSHARPLAAAIGTGAAVCLAAFSLVTAQAPGPGGPMKDDPVNAGVDWTKQPSVQPKTPAEELRTFGLQPGYRMELVLSDPQIEDPTAIMFDGDGRMFVLENPGYMANKDAEGELDPVGRISLWTDTNHDGVYDTHTVFVDHMVFPRFVTPYGPNTILTKESNAQEVWKYTDTNGDGVADKKELFGTGYGRIDNVEQEESSMTWALDNWLYTTFNTFRSRMTPSGLVKERTGSDLGSEWGLTQDDDGKVWFAEGSNGIPAYWQFPIVYGNVNIRDGLDPDARVPHGAAVRVADMQGGMGIVRMPDGSSKQTTAGAGGVIIRGDRLPEALYGKYCYGEPVARMVRCMAAEKREGLTFLHTITPDTEFITSTDPLFRPVDQKIAPDGTLYIADMYHGIVQERQWSGPGTYIRARIEQYDLDKIVHYGRIWRLVYDGVRPDHADAIPRDTTVPHMNAETPAQLVAHLDHPNGWWRDTAQQLLVLKQDRSVVPALEAMARGTEPKAASARPAEASGEGGLLGRFHALWTLEGLGALDANLVRDLLKAPEPRLRIQAIRASETLYKAGDKSFAADYDALAKDADVDVAIQALLTINRWSVPGALDTTQAVMAANQARGIQEVGKTFLNEAARAGRGRGGVPLAPEQQATLTRGQDIYNGLCISCHGPDGTGTPTADGHTTKAPPLAGSPRVNGHRDYITNVVLYGLTGAVDHHTYTDVMIPMGTNDDEWIAAVTSYVRHSFGNTGGFVTPADVARVRKESGARTVSWNIDDLQAALPVPLVRDGWTATASDNADIASRAFSLQTWNSGAPQHAGMWFQVELPAPRRLTEVQFESTAGVYQVARGRILNTDATGGRVSDEAPDATPRATTTEPLTPGYPRGYKVDVSTDGRTWTTVATGHDTTHDMVAIPSSGTGHRGESAATTIVSFAPMDAKYLRITETDTPDDAPVWSIQQLRLYEAGAGVK
jgi:mono/diheme cytochrome c family protein